MANINTKDLPTHQGFCSKELALREQENDIGRIKLNSKIN
jgi:hypothetical protein